MSSRSVLPFAVGDLEWRFSGFRVKKIRLPTLLDGQPGRRMRQYSGGVLTLLLWWRNSLRHRQLVVPMGRRMRTRRPLGRILWRTSVSVSRIRRMWTCRFDRFVLSASAGGQRSGRLVGRSLILQWCRHRVGVSVVIGMSLLLMYVETCRCIVSRVTITCVWRVTTTQRWMCP